LVVQRHQDRRPSIRVHLMPTNNCQRSVN
jgi:hypothetical protein